MILPFFTTACPISPTALEPFLFRYQSLSQSHPNSPHVYQWREEYKDSTPKQIPTPISSRLAACGHTTLAKKMKFDDPMPLLPLSCYVLCLHFSTGSHCDASNNSAFVFKLIFLRCVYHNISTATWQFILFTLDFAHLLSPNLSRSVHNFYTQSTNRGPSC